MGSVSKRTSNGPDPAQLPQSTDRNYLGSSRVDEAIQHRIKEDLGTTHDAGEDGVLFNFQEEEGVGDQYGLNEIEGGIGVD